MNAFECNTHNNVVIIYTCGITGWLQCVHGNDWNARDFYGIQCR